VVERRRNEGVEKGDRKDEAGEKNKEGRDAPTEASL